MSSETEKGNSDLSKIKAEIYNDENEHSFQTSDLISNINTNYEKISGVLNELMEKNEKNTMVLMQNLEKIKEIINSFEDFDVEKIPEKLKEKNLFQLSYFLGKFIEIYKKNRNKKEGNDNLTDKIALELQKLTGLEIIDVSETTKKINIKLIENQNIDMYITIQMKDNNFYIVEISPKEIDSSKYLNTYIENGNLFKFMVKIINEEFIPLLNKNNIN